MDSWHLPAQRQSAWLRSFSCYQLCHIPIAHLFAYKLSGKQKPCVSMHLAFLDLGKAFNRVWREVIWDAILEHVVAEELGRHLFGAFHLCWGVKTQRFPIFPGSPCCHQKARDTRSWEVRSLGVVLCYCCENVIELEREAQAWCEGLGSMSSSWISRKLSSYRMT